MVVLEFDGYDVCNTIQNYASLPQGLHMWIDTQGNLSIVRGDIYSCPVTYVPTRFKSRGFHTDMKSPFKPVAYFKDSKRPKNEVQYTRIGLHYDTLTQKIEMYMECSYQKIIMCCFGTLRIKIVK